uniref:DDE Tnp4 domain-containing protein n=1 Tax=Fundulus heteroclitus TaxID=8078 RepID=A0A3Q2QTY3_FUNHE
MLKRGAIPVLFEWNNYSVPVPRRTSVWERRPKEGEAESPAAAEPTVDRSEMVAPDHDYCVSPASGDMANELAIQKEALQKQAELLQREIERLHLRTRFCLERFRCSDDDIRHYTRFASYDLLMGFWALIEPFLPSTVGVHRRIGPLIDSTPSTRSLQPIDELFLFLNFLALGSKPMDLAERFRVHQSKVSRIIKAWSNFLFTVLGSMRIWVHGDQIQQNLPADFQQYPDTTVILGCTELSCQFSSRLLQKEAISSCKSHWTLKGLVGMAPHGAVTFVSPLYAVDNSDEHIAHESGLIDLLTPGMEVMVHRGVLIGDILPCKVVRPAFRRSQTSAGEVRETQASARLRAHVGRLFSRVKEHKLLDSDIPPGVFGIINQLYTVACLLINYENGPTVKA